VLPLYYLVEAIASDKKRFKPNKQGEAIAFAKTEQIVVPTTTPKEK
jgi:hypothetical protein